MNVQSAGALGPAPYSVKADYHSLGMKLLMILIPDTPDQNLLFTSIHCQSRVTSIHCQSRDWAPYRAFYIIIVNFKTIYFLFC